MKVCLIHPPQPNSLDDRLDVPLGLLYIAAVLRDDGNDVKVADLSSVSEQKWPDTVPYADIYGIMIYTCSYYIAKRIRDVCKMINPKAPVVVGGPHPTALPSETLQDFDIVVRGEGEYTMRDLVCRIEKKVKFSNIIEQSVVENLDSLPLPARDLVDLKSYHRKVGEDLATSLITSRGCPFNCAFCGSREMFKKVRYHSVDRVILELKSLVQMGFKNFIFYDDTFVSNRKRLYPMLKEMKGLNITFRCNGRAGINTLEDFQRLKDAGCHTIAFGIETGSQKILTKVNKRVTVKENIEAVRNAKKADLITKTYLVIGLPGENKETIEETKRFMEESDPDTYTLFTFVPLPGCDIWYHPGEYGVKILNKDWGQYYVIAGQGEGGVTLKTDTYTPEELIRLKNDLLKFLKNRPWRGTVENYEKQVNWRRIKK
jgi:radical SAM superfamily enzyme YgiQ (UPF0313 family)